MKPVLFNIPIPWDGSIPIRSYGFMVMLGFLAAIAVATWRAKRENADPNHVWDLWMWALIAGFVGARLLYVVLYWDQFSGDPVRIIKIWQGGIAFQGGFIGAVTAILIYLRVKRLPTLKYLDVIAAAVILGYGFARVGCFLNGCCHGHPSQVSWAVRYPFAAPMNAKGEMRYSPAYEVQSDPAGPPLPDWVRKDPRYKPLLDGKHLRRIPLAQIDQWHARGAPMPLCVPVHPTQLYAVGAALLIFLMLNLYYRMPRHEGQVGALFGMLYGVYRFINEFLRGDTARNYDGLTIYQLVSIGMIVVFGLMWLWCQKKAPKYRPPAR